MILMELVGHNPEADRRPEQDEVSDEAVIRRRLDIEDVTIFQTSKDKRLVAEAFGRIYDRYEMKIYGYIYSKVGSQDDAEELLSRFFFKILDKLHTFNEQGYGLNAWMYQIAHNLVANFLRDRARRNETPLDDQWHLASRAKSPEAVVMGLLENQALQKAISRLSADHQRVVKLKLKGLKNEKIAILMGLSVGAVKSLYHRATENLRIFMAEMGYDVQKPKNK